MLWCIEAAASEAYLLTYHICPVAFTVSIRFRTVTLCHCARFSLRKYVSGIQNCSQLPSCKRITVVFLMGVKASRGSRHACRKYMLMP